ncbi:T9SS type A sorting domain-containing protein [Hymenobacter aerophilus]|uniref:T9SS type A sorting domain-containing protein n=1 Tax=Hymenobacter aerophilus TaxID=119644 RepID=UPI00037BFE62|nr:T9SS type A sorting domain-containing protein [Hymenobacter aerophilus]
MKKTTTLALAATLATAFSAQAQITLDGVVKAEEIGTGAGKYQSLGAFSPKHVGDAGFGFAGLLRMYAANSTDKLYVSLAGTIEKGNNNFQLYMDLPGKSGVPVGTGLPSIAGPSTVFGTFTAGDGAIHSIGGTKLDLEADVAIATTGNGDVQAAIYTATTGVAKTIGGGAAITTDGKVNSIPGSATTGVYAPFAGTKVAYLAPTGNIETNPGNDNGGGAGSYALEYEFSRTALGLPSGASIVKLFAGYVSGDAFWSSDIIPETAGDGTNTGGNKNIGYSPDFTDQVKFPGLQAATVSVVVTSVRKADEAVVALSVFPNPSAGKSTIAYRVQDGSQPVSVRVLDLVGHEVRTLLDARQPVGTHELTVATGDLAAGTYLVNVRVGDKVATRRLAVTR